MRAVLAVVGLWWLATPAQAVDVVAEAEALRAAGDLRGALELLEAEHASDPNDAWVALSLGTLYHGLGSADRAVPLLETVIRTGSEDPQVIRNARYLLSLSLLSLMRYEESAAVVATAVEEDPTDAYAPYALGWAEVRRNRFDAAVAAFQLAADRGMEVAEADRDYALDQAKAHQALLDANRSATRMLVAGIAVLAVAAVVLARGIGRRPLAVTTRSEGAGVQ